MVMLVLGSVCKYILSLAERFNFTETISQVLVDSLSKPHQEWQVTIRLHLVAGYKALPSTPVHENITFMK